MLSKGKFTCGIGNTQRSWSLVFSQLTLSMVSNALYMRIKAADPLFLIKPLDASNAHHKTAIYAGKRFHVHQEVSVFFV